MTTIKSAATSTHFRATCNFNSEDEKGLHNRRDYLRVSFCAYSYFLQDKASWTCAVVDYINIRGYSCSKCSIPFYSSSSNPLFIYVAYVKSRCGQIDIRDITRDEDAFGRYAIINSKFSCTANSTSTTNWWIGGAIFD